MSNVDPSQDLRPEETGAEADSVRSEDEPTASEAVESAPEESAPSPATEGSTEGVLEESAEATAPEVIESPAPASEPEGGEPEQAEPKQAEPEGAESVESAPAEAAGQESPVEEPPEESAEAAPEEAAPPEPEEVPSEEPAEPAEAPVPEAAEAQAEESQAAETPAEEAPAEEAPAAEPVEQAAAVEPSEEAGADEEPAEKKPEPIGVPGMDWYIIHTYSGFENKVRESLRTRADAFGYGERIGEILIPTEDVIEMRAGKKVTSKRLLYPGYVLIQLKMDDELWHVVKNTPRVTGFVGSGQTPSPLTADEVNQTLYRQTVSAEKPRPKMTFDRSDRVKIVDGPFANFTGTVDEVNEDRNTLKVMVTIFGRGTPVELEYFQVEKESD